MCTVLTAAFQLTVKFKNMKFIKILQNFIDLAIYKSNKKLQISAGRIMLRAIHI